MKGMLDISWQRTICRNTTTAFLTPALRNRNIVLTPDVNLVGRPPQLYLFVLELLDSVHRRTVKTKALLTETIRQLIVLRDQRKKRLDVLIGELASTKNGIPLSSELIVRLLQQHLSCPRTSRLPVLMVAAAYNAASEYLKERVLPLESHTAADKQTNALGDLQIILLDDDNVVTGYEMKTNQVEKGDIDIAVEKIERSKHKIDNNIFVTTETIDKETYEYAKDLYSELGGIEIAILDCIDFIRYFLHLFYRLRIHFLDEYQTLVLSEPECNVSHPLKEAFLALRQAAESQ